MLTTIRAATRPSLPRAGGGRMLPGALLALVLAVSTASAQFDLSVSDIQVIQVIQLGDTPLVAGRTTFARAVIQVTEPSLFPPPTFDAFARVWIDGEEAPFSPLLSDNGPILLFGNSSLTSEGSTLNFKFIAPESSDVVIEVTVNPPGANFLPEADTSNNTTSAGPFAFGVQRRADLAYVPIDYRPNGETEPNLPDPSLIEPGVGDNFMHAIYPVADWDYHRIDAPSKLWTSSLEGTGSGLLGSLATDAALMSPSPDFIYGWVPGGLPYNGQAQIGGVASMGNTQTVRHQRTFAHEVGHCFGLPHNFESTGTVGTDVEEHLKITENLGLIKNPALKDIMYPGLLTPQAWVYENTYGFFYDHPVFDVAPAPAAQPEGAEVLFVSGVWDTSTGAVELIDVLTIPGARLAAPVAPAEADLVVRTFAGGAPAGELLVRASNATDESSGCAAGREGAVGSGDSAVGSPQVSFTASLPAWRGGVAVDRVVVAAAGARPAVTTELVRSASAPQAAFTSFADGRVAGGSPTVTWTAADPDGDALRAYLRYSPDGVRRVPLATGWTTGSFDVPFDRLPAPVEGHGFLELLVSDGLRTTRVRTEPFREVPAELGLGNAPESEILSPDNNTLSWLGAPVILHASGWDIEDRSLDGTSLVWTSDIDGFLGYGRLTQTSVLSVGSHVITVEATDSAGLSTTDTATVLVLDRGLPDVDTEVCQVDLGFGGPGASVLSVCGGELGSGSTADLALTGAPPNTTAFLFLGLANSPTPAKGGMLVPVPWLVFVPLPTDVDGAISIPGISGGNGPATLFAQFVIVDGAQPLGYGFSNAVQLDYLP